MRSLISLGRVLTLRNSLSYRIPLSWKTLSYHSSDVALSSTSHDPMESQHIVAPIHLDPFIDEPMEIIRHVAEDTRGHVRNYASKHKLKLVGILASSSNPFEDSSDTYASWISKTLEEDGIDYETWRVQMHTSTTELQLSRLVHRANHMDSVHGVLVYYPLFHKYPYVLGLDPITGVWSEDRERMKLKDPNNCTMILEKNKRVLPGLTYKTRDDVFRDTINSHRDVEGLGPLYHNRRLFCNPKIYIDNEDDGPLRQVLFPCTALAVVRIVKRALSCKQSALYDQTKPIGRRFEGTTVTIINRSDILGRPLASMLANDGAKVWSIDHDSIILYKPSTGRMNRCPGARMTMEKCIKESSVIVTAVPSGTFKINADWIQPHSTVVNVASEPNVDEDDLRGIHGVTYFPKVGAVTVAMLEQNLVKLHKRFHA